MKPVEKGSVKFKAVMFDLDGTLLDTLQDLADSMNAVLERFGFPSHRCKTTGILSVKAWPPSFAEPCPNPREIRK